MNGWDDIGRNALLRGWSLGDDISPVKEEWESTLLNLIWWPDASGVSTPRTRSGIKTDPYFEIDRSSSGTIGKCSHLVIAGLPSRGELPPQSESTV